MAAKQVAITSPARAAQQAEHFGTGQSRGAGETVDHRAARPAPRPGEGRMRPAGRQDERPGADAA